jgi:ATP-binding cassette subfamily B protein
MASGDRLLGRAVLVGLRQAAVAAVATALGTVLVLARPQLVADAVDAALRQDRAHAALATLVAVTVGLLATTVASQLAEAYGLASVTASLRRSVLDHVLAGRGRPIPQPCPQCGAVAPHAPADDCVDIAPGDVVSRVVSAAPQVGGITSLALDGIAGVVIAAGAIVAIWMIDWRIVAAMALAAPAAAAIGRSFVVATSTWAGRYQAAQGELSARLVDAVTGGRTIRASGTVRREVGRVLVPLPTLSRAGHAMWRAHGLTDSRAALLGPITSVTCLAVAGAGVAAGRTSPGELLAVAGYLPMALGLFDRIGVLAQLATTRVASRRLAEVLATPTMRYGRDALPAGDGDLELRGVTVAAGTSTRLDGVDLAVPAGTSMALVGPSGSGKSTLAAVAGRLVDPDAGDVRLDGMPLSDLTRASLRAAVAYAFERPHLVGRTIGHAIALGSTADRRRVATAAQAAHVDDVVRRLPAGYDSPPDVALSGGERQRLGLARAFARDARLLILDDATSNLDTVAEAHVRAAVSSAGRTRLIVTHRASTAAAADAVCWLDAGRVRRVGPHDELWHDADYRALFGAGEDPLEVDDAA